MPGVLEGAECYKRSLQFRRAPGMDRMGVWQVATRPLCVRMASNFYQGAKEGESPRRALHKCTMKCMLLQKGAVNYCGCISRIEGAYIRIVGASAPTKRYKITPLLSSKYHANGSVVEAGVALLAKTLLPVWSLNKKGKTIPQR